MSNSLINTFFRVFRYMKPVQGKYFTASGLASFELIMLFSIPFVNRMLVEMITDTGGGSNTVWHISFIMLGLLALTPLVAIGRYWQGLCAQKTADNLKKALFAHIQRLPIVSIGKRQTGDYLIRVTNDADWAGNMFQGFAIISLLRFLVVTAVTMTLLVIADWRIALLALVYNLVCFVLSLLLNPYVNRLEREARQEIAASSNIVLETMRSLPIVRVFAIGHVLAEKYRKRCEIVRQKRSKFRAANGTVYGVVDFFSFSSQAVGFIGAIFLLSRGEMALYDAVFTASLMALASDAMLRLSTFILLIQRPLVAAERVFEIIDEPTEMQGDPKDSKESAESKDSKDSNGICNLNLALNLDNSEAINLENLCFAYSDGTEALRNINLTIKQGEHVAIIGQSGGGKSTLAQIITSLYKPSGGEISYFGVNAKELSLEQIRSLIAYVPQEPILFEGTIYDNISLGRLGSKGTSKPSEAEIKKAAEDAGLLDLPLDTEVGERGGQLSGGQRQRVAIARAILKDAPLLILDEATSALDSDTEQLVQQALDKLVEGRTSITIAHRMSTIKGADRVIELELGEIKRD